VKPEYKKLYNSSAWHRLRTRQLRDHPLCADHLEGGRTVVATIVDHKVPHRGSEVLFFDEDNLQSLCKPCHDAHKQRLEKSGTVVGCDAKGIPLDRRHHWGR
jgi:5-methylcytosine-specific restriction endonuclease McrA